MHRVKRRLLLTGVVLIALAAIAFACGSDEPPPSGTTLEQTLGVDGEGNLVVADGEPYTVRTELIQAQSDRKDRRLSLVVFHQLSGLGIIDEESPLRSEWLEACDSTVHAGAFRPQESLSLHVAEALIAQANVVDRSPVTRAPVDFAIHTGSAVDNAQFNELRWFLDLMDGVPVDPESGAVGYQGVQTESPAEAYGDLLSLAQEAFIPVGLNYPWYAVAGNHDALSQGNFPITTSANQVATGAQKILALGPAAVAQHPLIAISFPGIPIEVGRLAVVEQAAEQHGNAARAVVRHGVVRARRRPICTAQPPRGAIPLPRLTAASRLHCSSKQYGHAPRAVI